jgi:hypothetical protein
MYTLAHQHFWTASRDALKVAWRLYVHCLWHAWHCSVSVPSAAARTGMARVAYAPALGSICACAVSLNPTWLRHDTLLLAFRKGGWD